MKLSTVGRHRHGGVSDEELSAQARNGDEAAFAELYRRHVAAAQRTARCMLRSRHDVDDVVSEAFAGVLSAWRNGAGPRDSFRAYLLACVRNGCYVRRHPPTPITDEQLESLTAPQEDPERYVEADTVARAFASLQPRWQRTLWLTEVEQRPAGEVAAELRLAPNATAALARRARQAFTTAYLDQHVTARTGSPGCAAAGPKLGAYVRGSLSERDHELVVAHLTGCADCTRAADELTDLNASLRSLAGPSAGLAAAGIGASGTSASLGGGVLASVVGASVLAKVAAIALLVVSAAAVIVHQVASGDASPLRALTPTAASTSPAGVGGTESPRSGVSSPGAPPGTDGEPAVRPSTTMATSTSPSPTVTAPATATVDGLRASIAGEIAAGIVAAPPELIAAAGIDPGVSLPGVPVPSIVVPPLGLPTLPTVPVAPVTVPQVTVPQVTVPPVTVPRVTVPRVTVPSVTVPRVTVPSVTVPPVTVLRVTVPPVTVPPVTVPPVTVPPVLP